MKGAKGRTEGTIHTREAAMDEHRLKNKETMGQQKQRETNDKHRKCIHKTSNVQEFEGTLCQGGSVGHGRCSSRSSSGHGNSGIEVHDWVCQSVSQSGEASPSRHCSKPHRNSPSFIPHTHHLPVTLASAIKPNGNPNQTKQEPNSNNSFLRKKL